jgi:hypothetical protein
MDGPGRSGSLFGKKGRSIKRPFWFKFLETDLDKKDRITKIFQFFFPWVLLVSIGTTSVLFLMAWKGWDVAEHLLDIWIFYTLPPAGKETIIPKAVAGGVPGWIAGPATSIVDVCISMFLIWNYDWVKKIPIMGPALERTEAKGRERVERARWFKRTAFIFCTFVVFVPFSGSGGFGGTIFGRVLGMNPYMVLLAVVIGSSIGSTGFAILSEQFVRFLEGTPFLEFMNNLNMIQLVVILIAIGFIIYVVRNPRMAAVRTTRVVSQALDVTERAVIMTGEAREMLTDETIRRTKDTLVAVGEVNRAFAEINIELATKPMEMMGYPGRKLAASTRRATRQTVEDAHKAAGEAIDQTLDIGKKATSWTADTMGDITMGGLGQTRKGWDEVGKVIVKGGEKMEKLTGKKKDKNSSDEE